MPEKVLEKILRYALVDTVAICVAADYPQESNEKHRGVLSVCHRLRELGRPIFYQENVFEVKIARFDVKAVLPWLKIVSPFLSDAEAAGAAAISNDADEESIGTESTTDIEAAQPAAPGAFDSNTNTTPVDTATPDTAHPKFGKPSARVIKIFSKSFNHFVKPVVNLDKAKPATRNQLKMLAYFLGSKLERTLIKEPALPGEVYFVPSYQPHWANLVEWMKLYHADEVGRYAYEKGDKNGSTGVQALFDFVQMEKEEGRGWAVFQTKLYALRGVLAASDERWLED